VLAVKHPPLLHVGRSEPLLLPQYSRRAVSSAETVDGAKVFIDGCFRTAAKAERVFEAATGEPLGDGSDATPLEIDAAVDAARRALGTWRSTPVTDRAAVLVRFAEALESQSARVADLCTRENGMPITMSSYANGIRPAEVLRYYANLITDMDAEEIRPAEIGSTSVSREPVGVIGAITPWNFPQALAAIKIAPALAAGCTVVLKAASETALDVVVLAAAARVSGLPPGVLNVLAGGATAGAYLVAHPGVDKVAFTGSTVAGRSIGEICGRLVRPALLELGGKSAAIIVEDVDLDSAIEGLKALCFVNNGQACYVNSRILAPRSRYDEIVDAVAALARGLVVGDPLSASTEIGPLVSARQRDRVLNYIDLGNSEGAKIVAGGGVPTDHPSGWFVSPTVFADVDNSWRIAQEEIFGPVVTITPYETESHAVAIANDSIYGLGGSVWSSDIDRAMGIARAVHTGSIGINGYTMDIGAPYGGVKASGIGRELGPEGLASYQNLKSIYLPSTS
jgi:aldehyde dehydrogenase (NAD+)